MILNTTSKNVLKALSLGPNPSQERVSGIKWKRGKAHSEKQLSTEEYNWIVGYETLRN